MTTSQETATPRGLSFNFRCWYRADLATARPNVRSSG